MSKTFPIQGERITKGWAASVRLVDIPSIRIPWAVAEIAYRAYAEEYGGDQSLERMAERGGFGRDEFLLFLQWATTDSREERAKMRREEDNR